MAKRRKRYIRKRRRLQITCWCGMYNFPHRLDGGKCFGRDWAESYYTYIRDQCPNCAANRDNVCDVAIGIEYIKVCSGKDDYLYRGLNKRLPIYELELEVSHSDYEEIECPF